MRRLRPLGGSLIHLGEFGSGAGTNNLLVFDVRMIYVQYTLKPQYMEKVLTVSKRDYFYVNNINILYFQTTTLKILLRMNFQ